MTQAKAANFRKMKNNHTKGNYYKSKSSGAGQYLVASEETGNTIAVVYNQGKDEDTEATAALLAAAPEMLKTLQMISKELLYGNYQGNHVKGMIYEADRAISKAIHY